MDRFNVFFKTKKGVIKINSFPLSKQSKDSLVSKLTDKSDGSNVIVRRVPGNPNIIFDCRVL